MNHTLKMKREARRAALLLLLSCLSATMLAFDARAQQASAPQAETIVHSVQIIPAPKSLKRTGDDYFYLGVARIVLAEPKSEEDRFAAQDFADDMKETVGIALRAGGGGKRRILVGPLSHKRVRASLERLGLDVPADLNEEGYVLAGDSDLIVVAGRSAAGTFYGLQTLKQLVRIRHGSVYVQGVQIVDWPSMRWRGLSDDISRGPAPTLEYFKRQIRTEAMFKMNMHSLYMEHIFGSESPPLIAPEGGALTPAEIRELVAYARKYHVELVPQQQTFGHLHKALRLEQYNELAEVPYGDVLSPQAEGTYKLVADWYRELDELFPGQFFHIGADDTFELGRGQSAEAVKARGLGPVYFDH